MFNFFRSLFLIILSAVVFFVWTKSIFNNITTLKVEAASYNQALSNAKSLESERDRLQKKVDTMPSESLARLEKLLPESVDNVRIILEISKLALPYGMVLKNIKYDTIDSSAGNSSVASTQNGLNTNPQDYGTWNLGFSTTGTYDNFIAFLKDLESNLRIIDISSIDFASDDATVTNPKLGSNQVYTYNFKIKTYWLKN
jgi:Tfp pilus assembly protein PilO